MFYIFNKNAKYESDATTFLRELKEKNPDLDEQQTKGLALLWGKPPIELGRKRRAANSSAGK
jgi:hypothetical protein